MRTKNSVDAAHVDDPCWATDISCPVKHRPAVCSAYDCGFYKPAGCKDFIRIEDKDGINFVPPEEYYEKAKLRPKTRTKHSTWKITTSTRK